MKILSFDFQTGLVLAAGLVSVSPAASLVFPNNQLLKIKTLSAYCFRTNGFSFIQSRGSVILTLSSNGGRLDQRLIANPNIEFNFFSLVNVGCPKEAPQAFVDGLVCRAGDNLSLTFTAYDFGTTALNDGVTVEVLMGYE